MSRPKGLDTESRAFVLYIWAIVAALAIGALFALNIAFTSVAHAQGARCVSVPQAEALVAKHYPDQEKVLLEGESAALFLTAFNARPPASSFEASEILIVYMPAFARVILFQDGCGYSLPPVKTKLVREWVKLARGTPV